MFDIKKEDLDYEVAISTFKDEVAHKKMLIEQYTYEFEKIIQASYSASRTNVQVVKFCRKIIQEIHTIIGGIKGYLNEIGLEFFNQLVCKMFRILIFSFNTLSQKFILILKGRNKTEQSEQKQKPKKDSSKSKYQNIKNQQKQMQYFDFAIRNLEEEQLKLQNRKKIMEKQLISEGRSIQTITASDTVNQLQNLNRDIQKIILNSQKIAGDNVLYRYQQLSKRILTLKKPQQIRDQFCHNFSGQIKSKFIVTMERIIKQFYLNIRQKQKQQLTLQILGAKPILVETCMQTQCDAKATQISALIREKKNLTCQIDSLKKCNLLLQKQIEKLGEKYKQSKQNNQTFEKKISNFDEILKKKASQIQKLKIQHQQSINKKNQAIQSLSKTNEDLKTLMNITESQSNLGQKQQQKSDEFLSESNTNVNLSKNRSFFRDRMSSTLYFQKELKQRKKENSIVRLGMLNLLQKLGQQNIVNKYSQLEMNQDLKSGNFFQKLEAIIKTMVQKLLEFKATEESQKLKGKGTLKERRQNSRINQNKHTQKIKKIGFRIEYGTQTLQFSTKDDIKIIKQNERVNTGGSIEKSVNKTNRLQALKKQFIQKISSKKKNVDYRLNKRYHLQQTYDSSDINNQTAQNYNAAQDDGECLQNKQKKKPLFSRKDISFQEFKLSQIHNNKTQCQTQQKKSSSKMQRKQIVFQDPIQTLSKQKTNNNQRRASKPIISIQSYDISKEVKACSHMIETKNDKKDCFLKNFIKLLLDQFRKKKGKAFIDNILKNEVPEIFQTSKQETKVDKPQQMGQQLLKTLR